MMRYLLAASTEINNQIYKPKSENKNENKNFSDICTERIIVHFLHMEKQELHLNFDPDKTSIETISKAIAAAGHDTDKDKAPDEVYNALPACCKYREP